MQIKTYVLSGVKHFVLSLPATSYTVEAIYGSDTSSFFRLWADELSASNTYIRKTYQEFGKGGILFHTKDGVNTFNEMMSFLLYSTQFEFRLFDIKMLFIQIAVILEKPPGIHRLLKEKNMLALNVVKIDESSFKIEYQDDTPDIFVYNDAVKEKLLSWANELRTTEKEQGSAGLYNINKDSYCCLGILGTQNGTVDPKSLDDKSYLNSEDMLRCLLQENTMFALQHFFSKLNDDANYSFPQIATVIEQLVERFDTSVSFYFEKKAN